MSGQEDFGPLLEALVTCVGVIDVISLFGSIFKGKAEKESSVDVNNNDVRRAHDTPTSSDLARSVPRVVVDGVAPSKLDDDVIDSLVSKVNELEAKVVELEIKSREGSMERFVEIERYRRSRSPSPFPIHSGTKAKDEESSSYDDETNTSSVESRECSVKRPSNLITRDDEFRKTKRSHESREEELMDFTKLEKEEAEDMEDFVPISYDGNSARHRHDISPIQETTSHGDIERSPEPGMSSMVEKPWCDIKKDAADIRKQEKRDQTRRSLSIDEQPAAEEKASHDLPSLNFPMKSVDVNETFIKMEQNTLQQSSKMLVKQAHVASEDQPEETTEEIEEPSTPFVEIVNDPLSDFIEPATSPFPEAADSSNPTENLTIDPVSIDNRAVRSTTPEPEVSMGQLSEAIKIEKSRDVEDHSNISGSPSSGEGLKRSKRCIDSLDRSASRSSSRLSRSKKSKTPSVASEEDYKEWFDKFDNHINPNLTVPENDDDDFDSDIEEEFLMNIDDGNLNGAEMCRIDDSETDSRDVSVSVTLNLKKSPAPVDVQKSKVEGFLEQERFRENQNRRLSIVPCTDEQQANFVSDLHPEEFTEKNQPNKTEPHQHHDHLHNIGYSEWMKKVVDHHSSHLTLSDSGSDSDVSLDEVRMLPLYVRK